MPRGPRDITLTVTYARGAAVATHPALELHLQTLHRPPVKVDLGLRTVTLGADPACDVVCEDQRVSRQHCQLSLGPDGVLLRDLQSKNGTLVAGILIREALLPPGVEVSIGDSTFRLVARDGERTVPLSTQASFGDAFGGSVPMRALFAHLEQAAKQDVSVLLWGESGAGKDILARAIHEHSPRAEGPFVVFDCAAASPTLAASTLFGHERGAFTGAESSQRGLFEEADGGTLLLSDISELPMEAQPLLLRALEQRATRRIGGGTDRSCDVRVIATSQRDLRRQMASGAFREDLFFRLATVEAFVPPLRERKDDLPMLVERFLSVLEPRRSLADLPARTLEMFAAYHWPGNVRELANAVKRSVLFPDEAQHPSGVGDGAPLAGTPMLPYRLAREAAAAAFEREYVRNQLMEHRGNVAAAAEAMGLSRQFLYRLIARHELRLPGRE